MSSTRIRSLEVRLAVRLAALYVAATAIAVGILIYQAYETAPLLVRPYARCPASDDRVLNRAKRP